MLYLSYPLAENVSKEQVFVPLVRGADTTYQFAHFEPRKYSIILWDEFEFATVDFKGNWKLAAQGRLMAQFNKYEKNKQIRVRVPQVIISNDSPMEFLEKSQLNDHQIQSILNR